MMFNRWVEDGLSWDVQSLLIMKGVMYMEVLAVRPVPVVLALGQNYYTNCALSAPRPNEHSSC